LKLKEIGQLLKIAKAFKEIIHKNIIRVVKKKKIFSNKHLERIKILKMRITLNLLQLKFHRLLKTLNMIERKINSIFFLLL
jgi:hypothetical protein